MFAGKRKNRPDAGDEGDWYSNDAEPSLPIRDDGEGDVPVEDGHAEDVTPRETSPDEIGTGRMLDRGEGDEREAGADPIAGDGGCPYVLVKRTEPDAVIPHGLNPGDAGFDLSAVDDTVIEPGRRAVVDTGIAIAIPRGFAGFVLSRSGLAAKDGVTVLNAPGLIDSGYRGSVKVVLINTGDHAKTLRKGDRVAQLVIQKVEDPYFTETDTLPESVRGEGGLGSTGTSD